MVKDLIVSNCWKLNKMYIHLLHKSNLFHQFFLLSFWFNIFLFKFHYFAVLLVICLQLILVFVVLEISNFVKLQLVYLFVFSCFCLLSECFSKRWISQLSSFYHLTLTGGGNIFSICSFLIYRFCQVIMLFLPLFY